MSDQFVGEIRAVGFNFAQVGWALCNGQLLSIAQNTALFSLLGTNFGGNGTSTFALPNLQGAMAVNSGQGVGLAPYYVGQMGGEASVTLSTPQMPSHNHVQQGTTAEAVSKLPSGATFGSGSRAKPIKYYLAGSGATTMHPRLLQSAGGNSAHNNMMPYLVLNFVIALQGIFPARP